MSFFRLLDCDRTLDGCLVYVRLILSHVEVFFGIRKGLGWALLLASVVFWVFLAFEHLTNV